MTRTLIPLVLASGCVSIDSTPPPSVSEPPAPHLHLAIDVFGSPGLELTLLDGTVVQHAFFEHGYADAIDMPRLARLPVRLLDPIVLPLGQCVDPTRDLVFQHVAYGSLQLLGADQIYGRIDFQCTYADGSTLADTSSVATVSGTGGEPL